MHHRYLAASAAVFSTLFFFGFSDVLAAEPLTAGAKSAVTASYGNVHIPDANETRGNDPFSILHGKPLSENTVLVQQLSANANVLTPQYIYELARRLWTNDRPKAMEWLAVGMARARYDALRCIDKSAQQGIAFLPAIAPDVVAGTKEDRKGFSEAGRRALGKPNLYGDGISPIWICSHGIEMINAAVQGKPSVDSEWIRPASEWGSLRNEVSKDLTRYFDEQGNLPNDPTPSNKEQLRTIVPIENGVAISNADTTFGKNGLFKIGIDSKKIFVKDGLIQPDGKIVVAVNLSDKNYKESIALVRVKPDGTLDDQFGTDGIVSTTIGANSRPEKIGLLSDGKIVVAGWAHISSDKQGISLTRYNADGSLDERFADRGIYILPKGQWPYAHALAVQPDGKVIVGGTIAIQQPRPDRGIGAFSNKEHFFLMRIDKAGVLDPDFGENGLVATDVGGGAKITALAIQRDGKIVASGTGKIDSKSRMIVARYDSSGSLDKHFGSGSFLVHEIEKGQYDSPSVAELPDGKLLVSSSVWSEKHLLLTRLLLNGAIDPTFAVGGSLMAPTGTMKYRTFPVLQPDGRVLVSGMVARVPKIDQSQPPYCNSIGVARFLVDGRGDSSFGPAGMQVVSIGTCMDRVAKVMMQGNGQVIAVGNVQSQTADHLVLLAFPP